MVIQWRLERSWSAQETDIDAPAEGVNSIAMNTGVYGLFLVVRSRPVRRRIRRKDICHPGIITGNIHAPVHLVRGNLPRVKSNKTSPGIHFPGMMTSPVTMKQGITSVLLNVTRSRRDRRLGISISLYRHQCTLRLVRQSYNMVYTMICPIKLYRHGVTGFWTYWIHIIQDWGRRDHVASIPRTEKRNTGSGLRKKTQGMMLGVRWYMEVTWMEKWETVMK